MNPRIGLPEKDPHVGALVALRCRWLHLEELALKWNSLIATYCDAISLKMQPLKKAWPPNWDTAKILDLTDVTGFQL